MLSVVLLSAVAPLLTTTNNLTGTYHLPGTYFAKVLKIFLRLFQSFWPLNLFYSVAKNNRTKSRELLSLYRANSEPGHNVIKITAVSVLRVGSDLTNKY